MLRDSVVLASLSTAVGLPVRVAPCTSWSGNPADTWVLTPAGDAFLLMNQERKLCVQAASPNPTAVPCDASSPAQQWVNASVSDSTFSLKSVGDASGRCLKTAATQYSLGPALVLSGCTSWSGMQGAAEWSFDEKTQELQGHGHGCCGDIFNTRPVCLKVDEFPKCKDLGGDWCDAALPESERVSALLRKMTLEEKASNMDSHNFGVPRLGVPPNVFGEALHGMCSGCGRSVDFGSYKSTGCPTSFPQVITQGAAWNRTMWSAIGAAVSDETRGLHSQPDVDFESALFLWSPNVNPFRDPRWGRGQEVASEEPLVCGEFGTHYVKALQGAVERDGRTYLKAVATAKHYFDYDLEGKDETDRQRISVNVSKRDQAEYYLPSFQSTIQRAKVASIMCSYNAVNGVPACMHGDMINDKMRGDWGFDGFVVSDCDALSDGASTRYIQQHFNGSLEAQAQQSLRGGSDLNCGALLGEQIVGAVQHGLLGEKEVDTALGRVYTQAVRLGLFDEAADAEANPFAGLGAENVDSPEHRALALDAALQGMVLLKNEATLPLDKPKKLALIGPHANGTTVFLGGPNYHGANEQVASMTPLLRAQAHLPDSEVSYAQGCDVSSDDKSGFDEAVKAAAAAGAVILVLGLDSSIENEGHDRESLTLPGVQSALALEVAKAAKVPVTVVLVNGGPLAIRELKESAQVGAILEAFFPGQVAGEAIMQTILGLSSPAGALPVTIYDADFVDRRPITNLDLRADGGVTYRYFDGEPLWPFGFALSYTSFSFSSTVETLHTTPEHVGRLCFNVTVSNTGARESDVVVLGFISSSHADAPRNGKLCDFQREHVSAGGSKVTELCAENALSLVDQEGRESIQPGEYTVTVGVKGSVGGSTAGSTIGKIVVAESIAWV